MTEKPQKQTKKMAVIKNCKLRLISPGLIHLRNRIRRRQKRRGLLPVIILIMINASKQAIAVPIK